MATIGDRVFDTGLAALDTEANRIDLTSQIATTYAEAITTYSLGNSTTLSIGAPADRGGGGREVTVAALADGTVTATGTATHFAIVDTANSRLLVAGSLSASRGVVSGDAFSVATFTVGIPDPA